MLINCPTLLMDTITIHAPTPRHFRVIQRCTINNITAPITEAWIGNNSAAELLTLTFTHKMVFATYVGYNGNFFGEGVYGTTIYLTAQSQEELPCSQPPLQCHGTILNPYTNTNGYNFSLESKIDYAYNKSLFYLANPKNIHSNNTLQKNSKMVKNTALKNNLNITPHSLSKNLFHNGNEKGNYLPNNVPPLPLTPPPTPTAPTMPPFLQDDVTLNILFVYSPQFLNTYKNIDQMNADINELCSIATGVFSENSPLYQVTVANVYTYLMADMQNGLESLDLMQITKLLINLKAAKYPTIDALKLQYQAHVVVMMPKVHRFYRYYGRAGIVGIKSPEQACIAIARGIMSYGKKLVEFSPTLLCHEIGHLLGCMHPLAENEPICTALLPGYGHHILDTPTTKFDKARNGTIMSYAKNRVWYFSNANRFSYHDPDQNIPCGLVGLSEAHQVVATMLPKLAVPF